MKFEAGMICLDTTDNRPLVITGEDDGGREVSGRCLNEDGTPQSFTYGFNRRDLRILYVPPGVGPKPGGSRPQVARVNPLNEPCRDFSGASNITISISMGENSK